MESKMPSILFVCTGNQFRSPIAAEAFRSLVLNDGRNTQWQVKSAGTWTTSGKYVLHKAVEVARTFGLNIEGHLTRALDKAMLEEFDIVLVMTTGHKESIQVDFPFARKKVHLISQVLEGIEYDIPDPAAANGETYEIIRDLVTMIRLGYKNIYKLVDSS